MKPLLIALIFAAAASGHAHAAKDGLLGTTSTGEVDIMMRIRTPKLVQISGLEPITFTVEDDTLPTIQFRVTDFCVYSNLGVNFDIVMTAGLLTHRGGTHLPYQFTLNSVDSTGQTTRLLNGGVGQTPVVLNAANIPPATTPHCDGTFENMQLRTTVRDDILGVVNGGSATARITFTVMAQ